MERKGGLRISWLGWGWEGLVGAEWGEVGEHGLKEIQSGTRRMGSVRGMMGVGWWVRVMGNGRGGWAGMNNTCLTKDGSKGS